MKKLTLSLMVAMVALLSGCVSSMYAEQMGVQPSPVQIKHALIDASEVFPEHISGFQYRTIAYDQFIDGRPVWIVPVQVAVADAVDVVAETRQFEVGMVETVRGQYKVVAVRPITSARYVLHSPGGTGDFGLIPELFSTCHFSGRYIWDDWLGYDDVGPCIDESKMTRLGVGD